MKYAAVHLDDWKLPVFKKHLDAAKLAYTEHPGLVKGTATLRVECHWISDAEPVIRAAYSECEKIKQAK